MRRAKIVCTLGPATDSYEQIKALVDAGMDVARFALGYEGRGEHEERYRWVRKAADETGRSVGVLADLRGPVSGPGPVLSPADEADLRWAVRTGFDVVALSFVRSGRDIEAVHRVMDEEGRRLPVLAKVEKPQAVAAIEDVVAAFDGIMVARGDLGVEMPLEHVPIVQKRAVRLAKRNAKPVVVATQMLDSMIEHARPTRAEVSDVANAVLDGTDAVMLSGETSVGRHPVEAVTTMARIVEAAEEGLLAAGLAPLTDRNKPRTRGGAVARAAAEIGDFLGARFLVAFTQSGDTVRRLSRYRSPIPLLAFTAEQATRSRLSLTWGVETFLGPAADTTDAMVAQVDELLLRYGRCARGDLVVITAGSPPGVPGTTNMVRVHRVGADDRPA
ncbi:pyruvate kinase [Streptomyces sp. NBC_00670]|jgi:pyruvate kinase|uniref:pyruvate kinase n=1 Tax=Streptomyces sp. NBC_00670 TaxID=2975804 RepID=UPI002E36B851|nr:pyruvate kinase [Streptomyces sp. NBC_00670]